MFWMSRPKDAQEGILRLRAGQPVSNEISSKRTSDTFTVHTLESLGSVRISSRGGEKDAVLANTEVEFSPEMQLRGDIALQGETRAMPRRINKTGFNCTSHSPIGLPFGLGLLIPPASQIGPTRLV